MKTELGADQIAIALDSDDPARQLAAFEDLARNRPETSDRALRDAFIRCIGAENKLVRRRAAQTAGEIARRDEQMVDSLREALSDPLSQRRFGAAYALACAGQPGFDMACAPPLYEALGGDDGDIRWAAHDLILELAHEFQDRVRSDLLALMRDVKGRPENRTDTLKMALYCLRDMDCGRRDILSAACDASRDRDMHVRLAAIAILAEAPADRACAAMVAKGLLETDEQAGVRRAAAAALGSIGDSSAPVLAALSRAAASPSDPALARAARAALSKLNSEQRS